MEGAKRRDDSKGHELKAGASRVARASAMASFKANVRQMLDERKALKYTVTFGKEVKDMTPKEMPECTLYREKSEALQAKVTHAVAYLKNKQLVSAPVSTIGSLRGTRAVGGLKLTMSDILEGVPSFKMIFSDLERDEDSTSTSDSSILCSETRPFVKLTLRQTETIVLFECNSTTVPIDADEAAEVEYDNKIYDYLTHGDGCFRMVNEGETQTIKTMTFSRAVGPKYIEPQDASACYSIRTEPENTIDNTTDASSHIADEDKATRPLQKTETFSMAAMRIERALAGNVYRRKQMRFRDLHEKSQSEYSYEVNELFRFKQPVFETYKNKGVKVRKAVSDISFCFGNADLIAVGYGTFSYVPHVQPKIGNVCIWSIKNPQNPERTYTYDAPVTAIAFSPFSHCLLAVGTSHGWVEVRDITTQHKPPLAVINRAMLQSTDPIVAIKWYKSSQSVYSHYHQFLAFTCSAIVQKFRFLRGPYLYGMELTKLDRVIGKIEGLPIISDLPSLRCMVYRRPIGLNLILDMQNDDFFYLLTDQGCLHKCSMRVMNIYNTTFRTHRGGVNCMEFSPWSPKIFLTCGNDWHIRIWMVGIYEPLCAITFHKAPITHAAWSPTHSTIILSLNRDRLDIWDLRCNLFKPKQSVYLAKGFNTLFRFSSSGSTIIIGKESGDAIVCALDEMPPPSHFQYDTLEQALYEAIEKESVRHIFKEAGYFGYYRKRSRKAFKDLYARI